ncbi:MAG TPA: hypothetical protein ENN17_00390 [bacterium]|nr:hypothetical protein [bacterium]
MKYTVLLFGLFVPVIGYAQFLDNFDQQNIEGWFWFTGDGDATLDFVQRERYASLMIDATKDKHNVYWTLIKRDVTEYLNLRKMQDPAYELRVEARVRVNRAPRRINFMINTQRTVDYHEHLMEFDIPDTTGWHVVSYTTNQFDARPGDTVYVQLCATDWGIGKYRVDVDYYRADVVVASLSGPDKGEPVPYHPPIPPVHTFLIHLNVTQDCLINSDFPDINLYDWHVKEPAGEVRVLTINANQWAILRWDFGSLKHAKAIDAGILELTTQSLPQGGNFIEAYGEDFGMEFGKVRVVEILGGDPEWDRKKVTWNSFMQGHSYDEVFNPQMIYDTELSVEPGTKTWITLSRPVLQRLLDGTTKGLLIRPLGTLNPSIYASEDRSGKGPKLYLNVMP